jgi:hypothetical protein
VGLKLIDQVTDSEVLGLLFKVKPTEVSVIFRKWMEFCLLFFKDVHLP